MTTDSKARASAKRKRTKKDMFLSLVDKTPVFGPPPRVEKWAKLRALRKDKMIAAPVSKMNGSNDDAQKARLNESAISEAPVDNGWNDWPNDSMTQKITVSE